MPLRAIIRPTCLSVIAAFVLIAVGPRVSAATVALSVADGARIADTTTVSARVVGFEATGIRKVEFSVDGRARGEDSSIPYTLEWDTLQDAEGEHTIEAVATDMQGATARASARVVIDNELGKGADHHAKIALEALRNNDRETATRHARRAIKADPRNITAARALSAMHKAAREYDAAIAVIEQATIPANEIAARRDLAELYVLRGDAGETTASLLDGVASAYEQHQRIAEAVAATLPPTASPVEKGDAAFAARKWSDAIKAYQSAGDPATMPMGWVNRLLLAYACAHRFRDCDLLLRTLAREKRGDDVTRAVQGFYLLKTHKPAEARQIVQGGVEGRVLPSLIVGACADLILGDKKRAGEKIEVAVTIAPQSPAVLYLQTFVTPEPMDVRRQIVMALAACPASPELLVRKGYDLLTSNRAKKIEEAEAVLEFARKVDQTYTDTLLATAGLLMLQKRPEEAQPVFDLLIAQDKDAPDVLVGQALNFSLLDKTRGITDLLNRAMKLDEDRWNDVYVPKPLDYINRLMRYRITPMLGPASLYPEG